MPSNVVIKISDLETAVQKALVHIKLPAHPPIINGIVIDRALIKDSDALDLAGKVMREMPAAAQGGAKPAAIMLPDKRYILGFIGDSAPKQL